MTLNLVVARNAVRMRNRSWAFALVLLASACAPDMDFRTSPEHGARLFAENCSACHGTDARGYSGASSKEFSAPDLTILSRENGGEFPEVDVLSTIDGLERHGDPDAIMPEFGAGDLGPTVVVEMETGLGTPVPADLLALSLYLDSIQR